jgi:ParB-like chromosome segregation protein Spo0J
MEEADLADLAADIQANGLRDPIWTLDGKILDGRNRYRACILNGIEYRTEPFAGTDPLAFVLSKNLHRRHLTTSQRAMVAASIEHQKHGGNRRLPVQDANLHLDRKAAADAVGVSPRAVADAAKVKEKGTPELQAAVMNGQASVHAAAAVADLPKAEQRKAVKNNTVPQTAKKAKQKEDDAADEVERGVATINTLCTRLDTIKNDLKEFCEAGPWKRFIHVESIVNYLEASRKALWQSRPTEPCNCLKHNDEPLMQCKACFGTGKMPACKVLKGGK